MTKALPLPSKEYLEECFEYDSETGLLTWKERPDYHFKTSGLARRWNGRHANTQALNCLHKFGYRNGMLNGKKVYSHRVIYKLIHGVDPNVILHSNKSRDNNKIEALTNGTQRENNIDRGKPSNNTTGIVGVYWYKRDSVWQVSIEGKYIGRFNSFEDAVAARKAAEKELGYSPNHGN